MCKMADQTLILSKLLSKVTYNGVLVQMPSGKHKFFGLYANPDCVRKSEKLRPLLSGNTERALSRMAFAIIRASELKPEEGKFVEEISGNKDQIWARKVALDSEYAQAAA